MWEFLDNAIMVSLDDFGTYNKRSFKRPMLKAYPDGLDV